MITRYIILTTILSSLLLGMNQTSYSVDEDLRDTSYAVQEKKYSEDDRVQYLFVNLILTPKDDDDYFFGTETDEKENGLSMEYYLQAYKLFYLKAGIGKTRYTYTESYPSSGAIVEHKNVSFNYIQAGVAIAAYEDKYSNITLDLDYMSPFSASAEGEIYGTSVLVKKPDSRAVFSCNANICADHICGGIGISSQRYGHGASFYFRIGGKW
ncbi:MAG: hypothetical protein ABFQ64_10265 [Campylobacterota bacterium]